VVWLGAAPAFAFSGAVLPSLRFRLGGDSAWPHRRHPGVPLVGARGLGRVLVFNRRNDAMMIEQRASGGCG
jgi:hypothetical protein